MLFNRGTLDAMYGDWADALGRFSLHPLQYYGRQPEEDADPPGSPASTALLAMLPGRCGATIVSVKPGELDVGKIVLPSAVTVTGKVIVDLPAGLVVGSNYVVHVLARHQGNGKLDEPMSVRTTANVDGTFELAGLSPEMYIVQASVDDVWVSPSVTVRVAPDGTTTPAGPIALKVQPGAAVMVELRDKAGGPLPGARVAPEVPPGPMTDLLRPPWLTADAAGRVLLSGLSAGEITLRIRPAGASGPGQEAKVTIPGQPTPDRELPPVTLP
jgi:hypothetical protein